MSQAGEFEFGPIQIADSWLDASAHMRASRHVVLFEEAIHAFLQASGASAPDQAADGHTPRAPFLWAPFLSEMHLSYRTEVGRDAELTISVRILGLEARRLHAFLAMRILPEMELATSCELDIICVNLGNRTSTQWPPAVHERFRQLHDRQLQQPVPAQAGRAIRKCRMP